MKQLQIKPCDNTFFREGNVFAKDISNLIRTKDIAYPSTFFGAIFSAFLAQNDDFREKFLNNKKKDDAYKILKIGKIYLQDKAQSLVYIPVPRDIFIGKKGNVYYGIFKENNGILSIPFDYYLENPTEKETEISDGYYINIDKFHLYYRKKSRQNFTIKNREEIFIKNQKTGIGLGKNLKNVEEGLLYSLEQTEFNDSSMHDWNFVVEYEFNTQFIKEQYGSCVENLSFGYLKLGGENKVAKFQVVENQDIQLFSEKDNEVCELHPSEKIKIVMLSPAILENISSMKLGNELKIEAVVTGKPIYIGGYDLMNRSAKTMKKGYAVGTVLLLKNISQAKIPNIKEYLDEIFVNFIGKGFNQYIWIKESNYE